jgi:hypothetical protein
MTLAVSPQLLNCENFACKKRNPSALQRGRYMGNLSAEARVRTPINPSHDSMKSSILRGVFSKSTVFLNFVVLMISEIAMQIECAPTDVTLEYIGRLSIDHIAH